MNWAAFTHFANKIVHFAIFLDMKSASISISQLLQLKAAQKNFILLISGTWQAKTDWSLISSVYQRIGSSAYVIFKLAIDINSEGEEYCIESLGLKALPSLALFSRGNLTRMLDLSNGLVADLSECRNAAYLLEEFMRYHSRNANITQQMMFSQSLGSMSNGTLGRLFLSGDRSSVGKSSMCLAVLVSLLKRGVPPSALAYIKPVTQCEAEQPVTQFCDRVGIANRGIGPIVFYKGFTRAYLNGETSSAEAMLEEAKAAVDEIGRGKQFVLVDGVGYPSVGSICNISNADVARKLDTPVLLVGKSGVGDAVDSYNLNSAYFELKGVHVLGGIFNKLPLDGYYSLDACRESVTSYFQQHKRAQMPYGFVPLIDIKPDAQCGVPSGGLAVSVDATASEAASVMDVDNPAEQAESGGIAFTDFENALSDVFMRHVDIDRLIHDVWIYEVNNYMLLIFHQYYLWY